MAEINVAVLVGSLRRRSINRLLALALEGLGKGRLEFIYPDLDLPLYNDDLWSDPPAGVLKLKECVEGADAILFLTPEYNRSLSPVIKNAIDWGSRPWGRNSWARKPAAVAGASPGQIGTAVAQAHLRAVLLSQDMMLMGQPELYFSRAAEIADDGQIQDEEVKQFLANFVAKFEDWILRTGATG